MTSSFVLAGKISFYWSLEIPFVLRQDDCYSDNRFESPEYTTDYNYNGLTSKIKFSLVMSFVRDRSGLTMEFFVRNLNSEDFDLALVNFRRLYSCNNQLCMLSDLPELNQKAITMKRSSEVMIARYNGGRNFFTPPLNQLESLSDIVVQTVYLDLQVYKLKSRPKSN